MWSVGKTFHGGLCFLKRGHRRGRLEPHCASKKVTPCRIPPQALRQQGLRIRRAQLSRRPVLQTHVAAISVRDVGVEILNHCIKPPKTGRDSNTGAAPVAGQ